ncbi:MAG: hypothetical protein IIC82_04945 [Chloroflexi bacterium]|nr:hypothetical protein [Chloroflexota bacterium]
MTEAWYIAKSKPQREGWLMTCLSTLGVEVFYPTMLRQRRGKRVKEPVFPTYVFCRFDLRTPDWPSIRWAPGLNYFLGMDGRPSPVPEDLIEHVRRRSEWWNEVGFFSEELKPGDSVVVSSGPFAGIEGVFDRRINSRQRCRVLLKIVGRLTAVELPEYELDTRMPSLG